MAALSGLLVDPALIATGAPAGFVLLRVVNVVRRPVVFQSTYLTTRSVVMR